MILSGEDVLYQLEMRIKTQVIVGTLCKVKSPEYLHNAMMYFDIWNHGSYISQPYTTLTPTLFDNMTKDLFRIAVEYIQHHRPRFSDEEIRLINEASQKWGYRITMHGNRLSFRRGASR